MSRPSDENQALERDFYLQQFLDLGNSGGSSDEDDVVDLGFVHFGIAQRFLDGFQSATEKISAKIFETSARDRSVKVDTLVQRIDLDTEGANGNNK